MAEAHDDGPARDGEQARGGTAGSPPHPDPNRDRDPDGRPRNARPRDALGRPLPRGTAGTAPPPIPASGPPAAVLEAAQHLLDEGRPFHAHEVLETAWRTAPDDERELWRGLAQLAVGLTHLYRGNAAGAAALLARGRDRVAGYATSPPHGVDVAGLLRWSGTLLADLADDPPRAASRPPAPRLRTGTRPEPGGAGP